MKPSEIVDERKWLEDTAAKRKESSDSVIKDSNKQIKKLVVRRAVYKKFNERIYQLRDIHATKS